MMPSAPHNSTMGTGERSRVSVTVFRLCGQAWSGPRPVEVQSSARIRAATSPPLAANYPPDPADPAWSGTSSPSKTPQHDAGKTLRTAPWFPLTGVGTTTYRLTSPSRQCFAALLAAALLSTIKPSTATPVLALIRNGL